MKRFTAPRRPGSDTSGASPEASTMKRSNRLAAALIGAALAMALSAVAARTAGTGLRERARRLSAAVGAAVHCYPLAMDLMGGLRGDRTCRPGNVGPR
jgi:hypothetical protein